jgi:hypothetical protein
MLEEEQRKDNPVSESNVITLYSYKKTFRASKKFLDINKTIALISRIIVWKNEVCESKVKTSFGEINEIPILSKNTCTVISKATGVQKELSEVSDKKPKFFVVEK